MFFKVVLLLAFSVSVFAVELESSCPSVAPGSSKQRAGALTIRVQANDFPFASESPVYLRFSLPPGVVLDNTLVGPSQSPIGLYPILTATSPEFGLNVSADDVLLVRFVKGESDFYIRVGLSTDQWLSSSGKLISSPNQEASVSFTIGSSAGVSTNYGFYNTRGALVAGTEITLKLPYFVPQTEISLAMTAFQKGFNLDPTRAKEPWAAPILDPDDLVPVTANQCPKIARAGRQGLIFPFKEKVE